MTPSDIFETVWKEFDVTGKNYILRMQLDSFVEAIEKLIGKEIFPESHRLKLRRYSPQYAFEKIDKNEVPKLIESFLGGFISELQNHSFQTIKEEPDLLLESRIKSPDRLRKSPKSVLPRSPKTPRRFSDSRFGSHDALNEAIRRSPHRYGSIFEEKKFIPKQDMEFGIKEQRLELQKVIEENIRLRQQLEDVFKENDINSVLYDSIKKKAKLQELKIQSLINQLNSFRYSTDRSSSSQDLKNNSKLEIIKDGATKRNILSKIVVPLNFDRTKSVMIFISLISIISILSLYSQEVNYLITLLWNILQFLQKLIFTSSKGPTTGFNKDWTYDDIVTSDIDLNRIVNYGRF